jgi:ComF family protein
MRPTSSIIGHLYDATLTLIYPQPCTVCGRSVERRADGVACSLCWNATQIFTEEDTLCWKCGALTSAHVTEARRKDIRCGHCDNDAYTSARACGSYEGALRAAILNLKRAPQVAPRLAGLMLALQQRAPLNCADLIIPVPLHGERERERGFNQALLLAQELARLAQLPLDEHSVFRQVHTERHRAGMDSKARRKSVNGAFGVRHPDLIAGRRVMLIDDVFTTGATVSACAEALTNAGAEEVFVLTVARA